MGAWMESHSQTQSCTTECEWILMGSERQSHKPQVDTTSDTYTHLAPQAAKAPVPSQPDESVTSNFTIEQSTIKNHECCKRN